MAKNILFVLAHSHYSTSIANKGIVNKVAASGVAKVHDLYATYPDGKINVEKEQELLKWADLVVFQFAMNWYSTPALLKEWQDKVLKYGFAFTMDGSPSQLRGKEALVSFTSASPKESYSPASYNRFTYEELLRPLEQTVAMCQMKWLGLRPLDGMQTSFNPASPTKEAELVAIEQHANELVSFLKQYAA